MNPCVVRKKESGRSANHFKCEEKHDENTEEAVFQPDLNAFVICGVCKCATNLERICKCFRSTFAVFLKLTASLCLSCAKKMLHLSQRKHWPWDVKNFAASKSNPSKHGAYHIHAWQISKIMHGSFSCTKSQYYVDFSLRKKGVASVFFKLIALTAEKVFVIVMQIDLLVCHPVENFSSLSSMSVWDAYYLHCCILDCDLCAMAAHNCSPLPPPRGSHQVVQERVNPEYNLLN